MIDIQIESLIPFPEIPAWCKKHLGKGIHASTAHRWRLRGIRGVKLETILAGGTRFTSYEALQTFFADSTKAADGELSAGVPRVLPDLKTDQAQVYLESEGF